MMPVHFHVHCSFIVYLRMNILTLLKSQTLKASAVEDTNLSLISTRNTLTFFRKIKQMKETLSERWHRLYRS